VEGLIVSASRMLEFNLIEKEKELRTAYDHEIGLDEEAVEIMAELNQSDYQKIWPPHPISNFKIILQDIAQTCQRS
jgi:hypothetical protein